MRIQEFVSTLQNVKGGPERYTARCPAHDDRINSLSVALGNDKRILVKCHAGCGVDDVLERLSLSLSDLFDDPPRSRIMPPLHLVKPGFVQDRTDPRHPLPPDKPSYRDTPPYTNYKQHTDNTNDTYELSSARQTIYPYEDEDGRLLFEVVRYQFKDGTKTFRQRRMTDEGITYSLGGMRPVLYRLPQVRECINRGVGMIVVCEGEKDADALSAHGVVATTSPMGAGKWRDAYTQHLCGAQHVYIVPDNDKAGRGHALDIGRALEEAGIPCSVADPATVCAQLPPKGDISDVLELMGPAGVSEMLDLAMTPERFREVAAERDRLDAERMARERADEAHRDADTDRNAGSGPEGMRGGEGLNDGRGDIMGRAARADAEHGNAGANRAGGSGAAGERRDLAAEAYVFETVEGYLNGDFWEDVRRQGEGPEVTTGFAALDAQLGGRLYPGLYVIGAVSSLGKTAFCLQMADHIAQRGNDVLFFSLEMPRVEMVARSLVRDIFLRGQGESDVSIGHVMYGRVDKPVMDAAARAYGEGPGRHIAVIEGGFDMDVMSLGERVRCHVKATGRRPVVFVDYLQILRPPDLRMTDKQVVDYNVVSLKRLSRDFNIPVVVVSSFNRQNYAEEVNLASFKESGAIEYSADFVMGLQARGVSQKADEMGGDERKLARAVMQETKKAKQMDPRPIEAVILKNRRGPAWARFGLEFYARGNLFIEGK